MTKIARRAKNSLELVHAMIYFAPEAADAFAGLGLDRGRMSYFAGRAAPMGPVGPGVVAATFYSFNPAAVAEVIPRAWQLAAPEAVVAARFEAADAALRRMLGADVLSSELVAETAGLARRAAEACPPDGKPLFAGHADLAWPEAAHLRLWHAVTLLREFRGDAHLAALQRGGLSGLEALVLHTATGETFTEEVSKEMRGWSDQEWATAARGLRERGLLGAEGEITAAGTALREEVEADTDAMSMAPWAALGEDGVEALTRGGAQLSKALAEAGALPPGLFARG